jgi:chromosome partitioning protein
MIVTVGGIKGGSGKSTVATNLAVIRSQEGHDVLLIDADDQETSSDFTMLRNESIEGGAGFTSIKLTGPAVRTETLRLKEKYEDIIIDTGGRDTTSQRAALSVSDALLIPFMPRSFDLWTIDKVAELVEEMRMANPNLSAYTFLSKADSRGSDNDDTADLLKSSERLQFIEPSLGLRKAFSNAAAAGLAVTEAKPQDPKAIEEMLLLYRFIFKIESTL